MKFKIILLVLSLFSSFSYADTKFKSESLISPQETWQAVIPEKVLGNFKVTISFIETKFYNEDIVNNRFSNIERGSSILTGFQLADVVGNPKIPDNCPHPRVPISIVEGVRDSKGRILLTTKNNSPIFNGMLDFFKSVSTIEIDKIKGNEGEITLSSMFFTYSEHPFDAQRLGPYKIKRIQ